MRRAAVDRPLRTLVGEKAINQARGKRIAAADAIENLEILARRCLKELAVAETNRAPVVNGRRLGLAQGGGDDLEIRKLAGDARDHFLEVCRVKFGMMLVQPFDLESKRGSEIFFVAQHPIDTRS